MWSTVEQEFVSLHQLKMYHYEIDFLIRKKTKSTDFETQVPVYVRIREGRKFDRWIPTRIMVNPNLWDSKEECIKKRVVCDEKMRQHVDGEVKNLRRFIEDGYEKERNLIDAEWPNNIVDRYYHPEDYIEESVEERHYTLLELFDIFWISIGCRKSERKTSE